MDWKKWAMILALFLCWSGPPPLAAHGLFIFAWAEGDRICTDSYFSRNNKARGARISMMDQAGTVLASGLTDSQGGFCFQRPEAPQNLVFIVEAGGGHRGQFKLPADTLPPAAPSLAESGAPEAAPPEAGLAGGNFAPLDTETLRQVLRAELAAQLGPLNRKLAADEARAEPGLREIAGGLGWLAGLAGLGFWLAARQRARKAEKRASCSKAG